MGHRYSCYPLAAFFIAVVIRPAIADEGPLPLHTAHAHNDYLHNRPLMDALAHGFCSVEADVFAVDGQLLVGHDVDQLRPDRTLQRLYLDPLRERIQQHAGRVYRDGPPFTLLIDFKSAAEPTYAILVRELAAYQSMLVRSIGGQLCPGAVHVIISGNRPIATVAKAYERSDACLVSIDGRLADLADNSPRPWMPLISDRWTAHFRYDGQGPMPADERTRLQEIVRSAHSQGRRIRFWATPDRPEMWRALRAAGVDLLNTDDLSGMTAYLRRASSSGVPR
jgi:hypothetical protein